MNTRQLLPNLRLFEIVGCSGIGSVVEEVGLLEEHLSDRCESLAQGQSSSLAEGSELDDLGERSVRRPIKGPLTIF